MLADRRFDFAYFGFAQHIAALRSAGSTSRSMLAERLVLSGAEVIRGDTAYGQEADCF